MNTNKICRVVMAAALLPVPLALSAGERAPRATLNVVNFVRSSMDPRTPRGELVAALKGEVDLNLKYGLPNTILFQYDAMLDDEMVAIARRSDSAVTEFGVWIELCRPLIEKVGIAWHSPHGWDWDWHIDPGFLMAYAPKEREAIVDEIFAKFKSLFGAYPKSVGSWLLDAHSIAYMAERYGVDGFGVCREQDSTDAYGLRGGYSNGLYYPSRKNMLSAAVDMANAVRAPVFKLLTPDPIYNYSSPDKFYADFPVKGGCVTLEPVWHSGRTPSVVDWYFRTYCDAPGLMNLSYIQVGQENAFGWTRISKGLPYQMERVAALAKEGRLRVETMGETARRFKAEHPRNCPQTQVALEDWSGCGRKSVWYNCASYRANLLLERGRLAFRDIHVMRDDYAETFLDKPCKAWQALYYTPPVVDAYLAREDAQWREVALDGEFASLEVAANGQDALTVKGVRKDGTAATVTFRDGTLTVDGAALDWKRLAAGDIAFAFDGYRYSIGCAISPDRRQTTLDLRPVRPSAVP